jgi:hypothetical protein
VLGKGFQHPLRFGSVISLSREPFQGRAGPALQRTCLTRGAAHDVAEARLKTCPNVFIYCELLDCTASDVDSRGLRHSASSPLLGRTTTQRVAPVCGARPLLPRATQRAAGLVCGPHASVFTAPLPAPLRARPRPALPPRPPCRPSPFRARARAAPARVPGPCPRRPAINGQEDIESGRRAVSLPDASRRTCFPLQGSSPGPSRLPALPPSRARGRPTTHPTQVGVGWDLPSPAGCHACARPPVRPRVCKSVFLPALLPVRPQQRGP